MHDHIVTKYQRKLLIHHVCFSLLNYTTTGNTEQEKVEARDYNKRLSSACNYM